MTEANEIWARAFRLHRQGKLREAFLRYDAIVKATPDHAPTLHYSGVVLYQAGKVPEAAQRIRASLDIEPASADAWSNLSLVLDAAGQREAARNALLEAAKLAAESPDVLANLSAAEFAVGRVAEAEQAARRAIAANGQHAAAWHNLALALEPQGRLLEALDAASRAAALAPGEPAYAGLKAQLEITAGMRKKARVAPLGITWMVHSPAAGLSTKSSSLNWLEFWPVPATDPSGAMAWNSNESSREGVSIATRRRAPGLVSRSGYVRMSPSLTVSPSQNAEPPESSTIGSEARPRAGTLRRAMIAAASARPERASHIHRTV